MRDFRINKVQAALGALIPSDYLSFIATHEAKDEPNLVVASNPDYWGVRCLYELGNGEPSSQLDTVYHQVSDVLPAGVLPIAEDWSGNFYCLFCSGPKAGHVVWWDHERDVSDYHTDFVANSFSGFINGLCRTAA